MSTRSSIWYGLDEEKGYCHIYWELQERTPAGGAPLYLELKREGKELTIRLPREIAQQLRDFLDPDGTWEPI